LDSLGEHPARPVDLDLAGAVRAAVELARPGLARAGLNLRVELPRSPLRARAVPDHLRQVLANLLQNAQRYTPSGGLVIVGARAGSAASRPASRRSSASSSTSAQGGSSAAPGRIARVRSSTVAVPSGRSRKSGSTSRRPAGSGSPSR